MFKVYPDFNKMGIIKANTKNSTDLINWYLNDPESLKTLEQIRDNLWEEYMTNLNGDIRIKYNHIDSLLRNWHNMDDEIRSVFFNIISTEFPKH